MARPLRERHRLVKLVSVAILLAAMTSAASALAEGPPSSGGTGPRPTTVRLDYRAAEGCPDAAAFARDASRRTPRLVVESAPDAERVVVVLTSIEGGFEGRLARAGSEPYVERGRACHTVASILALTLALSIDPESKTDIAPEPGPPPASSPPSLAPVVTPPAPASAPPIDAVPAPPPSPRRLAVGAEVLVLAGAFEDTLGGLGLFVETRLRTSRATPIRLRARAMGFGQSEPPAGREARVALLALGFDACAFELARGPLSLRPCVGIEPGLASAEARGVAQPSSGQAGWLSVSARGRAELTFVPAFGLAIEGGATAVLLRPRFTIDPPGRVAAEARGFAAVLSLGLWVAFP